MHQKTERNIKIILSILVVGVLCVVIYLLMSNKSLWKPGEEVNEQEQSHGYMPEEIKETLEIKAKEVPPAEGSDISKSLEATLEEDTTRPSKPEIESALGGKLE